MRNLDFHLRMYKNHVGEIEYLLVSRLVNTNSVHWLARMDSYAPELVATEEFAKKSKHISGETRVVEVARFAAQMSRNGALEHSSNGIAGNDIDAKKSRRICSGLRRVIISNNY